jgi:hypothetical protein
MCEACNTSAANEQPVCRSCAATESAESSANFKERQEIQDQLNALSAKQAGKKSRTITRIQYVLILAAISIIPLNMVRMQSASEEIIIDTNNPVELENECINLLFDIGELLEQGQLPDPGIACPGSPLPLNIQQSPENIVVSVPNPEDYDYSVMLVSRNEPIPTLAD